MNKSFVTLFCNYSNCICNFKRIILFTLDLNNRENPKKIENEIFKRQSKMFLVLAIKFSIVFLVTMSVFFLFYKNCNLEFVFST